MIQIYTGTCGSGKTYSAIKRIIYELKHKKYVITNIVLDKNAISKYYKIDKNFLDEHILMLDNGDLSTNLLINFYHKNLKPKKENQCLIVIDEASDVFNSRTWNDKNRLNWLKFFRVHRHFGFNILFISQDKKYLDKQILGIIEEEINHRNIKHYKLIGWFLSLILGGFFVRVTYWAQLNEYEYAEFFRLDKKVYKCYDTFQCLYDNIDDVFKE